MKLESAAPAKINLALHVTGRRDDGYHTLESLVVFAGYGDRLTAAAADRDSFSVRGPFAAGLPGEANLVLRARDLLRERFGARAERPVALTLEKNLPVAAGVGGGSSDAAAALNLLVRFWGIDAQPAALAEIGVRLGADIPMCLAARPLIARGIGETLEPVPSLPPLSILLVNPGLPLATPVVFAALMERENPPLRALPPDAGLAELVDWLRRARNDLEPPALSLMPEIGGVLGQMRTEGALIARMSGSGATCYGIFKTPGEARRAGIAIAGRHPRWLVQATTTMTSTPEFGHA
ncbi:4-(cytidine 5'-diphospho)-2-C-methyl-D-erythritol kinase [Chelativorans sp. AA-79]|uniref:4-(cytidine 5'-diphospho)-2-C-methyl-D-erythritol kinase n=1 Tax=Chelativorans sp. AA-79 TaxID=3028735 RepID=UPI0023F9ACFB|nr:4-(cytidine 5'-diphospho)-2-C-methyl-D-erythritol kinase [Chelativorans sp. AA-79]WEX08119.1 4-(cytidine 5'-diphospho)-2-C-methyl-D-erythritol kinase [Chelativorans sp. AA-79]